MKIRLVYLLIILTAFSSNFLFQINLLAGSDEPLKIFPDTYENKPNLPSPMVTEDGQEIVLVFLRGSQRYTLIPVTVENGNPLLYSRKIRSLFGKDRQLDINSGDFPTLARTGLHSEADLENKKTITGLPVELITTIARPRGFSYCGFLADDEDILSVLKADNRQVKDLGLTHSRLARPLFQVWNMILEEIKSGKMRRFSNIHHFYYNGNKIDLKAEATKGWQASIFQDEIQGKFHITLSRPLTESDRTRLKNSHQHLSPPQMTELENKLTRIHFSEMVPFYIMRYGFYEGHTDYRADPVAIAFMFGLKNLEEILETIKGDLHKTLTTHFIQQN